jgi:hypothetical protein
MYDTQGDGHDLGDACSDAGGYLYQGCMNTSCTDNGYGQGPAPINHPPGECPFEDENNSNIQGCCTPFCDADNPCDPGWFCAMNFVPLDGYGSCIWNG